MTIAYFCILAVGVLPYVWALCAKKSAFSGGQYDNHAPRAFLASLHGAEQRANWAQQNAFESLPLFVAGVIIAHLAGASQYLIDTLAVVHLIARTLYGICYITDRATLRSLVWTIGLLSVVGLFVISC